MFSAFSPLLVQRGRRSRQRAHDRLRTTKPASGRLEAGRAQTHARDHAIRRQAGARRAIQERMLGVTG
jgi:hypothetical protein